MSSDLIKEECCFLKHMIGQPGADTHTTNQDTNPSGSHHRSVLMNSDENLFSGHEIEPLRLEAGGRDLKTDSRFPRMNFPPTFSSGDEESSAGVIHFLSFQLLPSQTASQTPSRKVLFTVHDHRVLCHILKMWVHRGSVCDGFPHLHLE